jgi:hypothetical protein
MEDQSTTDCEPAATPDLLYLSILDDAVQGTSTTARATTVIYSPVGSRRGDSPEHPGHCWADLPQLDGVDHEYLAKKGVFDLPTPRCL